MKKQLLIPFVKLLSPKKSLRMAAFAAFTLLTAQSSFAQWVGTTSTDFLDATNWSTAPTSAPNADASGGATYSTSISLGVVTSPNFNPVLNTGVSTDNFTFTTIFVNTGANLTTHNNVTTNTSTSTVDGTLNINAGTWTSPKLYIGNTIGTGTINVAAGASLVGVTGGAAWNLGVSRSGTNTINVNGTYTMAMGLNIGSPSSGGRKGVLNINTGGKAQLNAGVVVNYAASTVNGTINVAGGELEYSPADIVVNGAINVGTISVPAGSFKLLNTTAATINATSAATMGVINFNGGTLETSGPLTIGNSAVAGTGLVTVNLTSGTMKVNGALAISAPTTPGTYTGLINVDAGSIVLTGDQKTAMEALTGATVGGLKAVAGKTISVTYDAGTDKTTVVAITTPLGVNDVKLDANAIVVYAQDKNIKIQSENVILSDVKVYDVTGRLLASKKSIGSNETSIVLDASNQVYVVKVTTADGSVVTKKLIQ